MHKSKTLFSVNEKTERHKVSKIILAFLTSISSQSKISVLKALSVTHRESRHEGLMVCTKASLLLRKKLIKQRDGSLTGVERKGQSDLTSEVFWGWSHGRERCPSWHADVYSLRGCFPTQTNKCSGPHFVLSSTMGDGTNWRQHFISVFQLTVMDSPSSICTPDSVNWVHGKCCRELPKPLVNAACKDISTWSDVSPLLSPPAAHRSAPGLGRVAELHTGCSKARRGTQGTQRGRKACSLPHGSALPTSGCSGLRSHGGTLPPCGKSLSSPGAGEGHEEMAPSLISAR